MKAIITILISFILTESICQVKIDSIKTIVNGGWPLYKNANDKEPSFYGLKKGDSVIIDGYANDRFHVITKHRNKYDNRIFINGYLITYAVDGLDELKRKVEDYSMKESALKEKEKKALNYKVLNELTNKYGSNTAKRILNSEYWIGMTKDMAILSLGKPNDINRTITATSISEQWIYPNSLYLYFKDDKVITIQD